MPILTKLREAAVHSMGSLFMSPLCAQIATISHNSCFVLSKINAFCKDHKGCNLIFLLLRFL